MTSTKSQGERQFQRLVENIPGVVAYLDLVQRDDPSRSIPLYIGPQVENLLGYPREAWLTEGELWLQVLHPDDAERMILADRRARETLSYLSAEYRMVARDGRVVWVSEKATVVADPVTGTAYWQGVMVDITERKRAEEALVLSEHRLRSAFDGAAVGMVITDPERRVVRANATFARMLGFAPAELQGKCLDDLTLADDRELSPAHARQLIAGELGSVVFEKRYVRRDGATVNALVSSTAIRGPGGKVREFVAQVEDISRLRHVERELMGSQRLYRAVVEGSRDVIAVLGVEGRLLLVSPSVEEILGYTPAELMEARFEDFIEPHDLARVFEAVRVAFGEGGRSPETRARFRRKDGSFRMLEGTAATASQNGEGPVVVVTAHDVTKREQLEEQLRQAAKMEAIGQLAGGIAHDFNNLLTAINGYADVVLARLEGGDERVRHGVEQIRRAGEQAAVLTSQLLTFSRQQQLRDEALDLNAVTASHVAMLERLLGPEVEVELRLDPDLPPVDGDAGQLGQVILNLIVNARDAMPDGGRLSIETAALTSPAGRFAVLTVSDAGCGMDAATRERIFDPFFSTKETDTGTGLGLSIVHGIVEQFGGAIACSSEPGLGSTFTVQLPAAAGAPVLRASGGRVLLVQGDEPVRRLAHELLADAGYEAVDAATPAEALALAADGDFDLLVTDVVMPELNGPDLLARLREGSPGLRVLYTSGYGGEAVSGCGVLDADAPFLQRPFTREALRRKVREALEA